jgi:hypothetical protein
LSEAQRGQELFAQNFPRVNGWPEPARITSDSLRSRPRRHGFLPTGSSAGIGRSAVADVARVVVINDEQIALGAEVPSEARVRANGVLTSSKKSSSSSFVPCGRTPHTERPTRYCRRAFRWMKFITVRDAERS